MDGVLVIDKPQGLTSHDVVTAARRALGEKRIGHTGTLDPLATGILPLAVGRATRLVRFLTASDKDYDATVRFGVTTDSYDTTGAETGRTDLVPSRDALLTAVEALTGDCNRRRPSRRRRLKAVAHIGLPGWDSPWPLRPCRCECPALICSNSAEGAPGSR